MSCLESNDCWERCQAANWPIIVSRSGCTRLLGDAGLFVPNCTEVVCWRKVHRHLLNLAAELNIIICFANVVVEFSIRMLVFQVKYTCGRHCFSF